MVPTTQWSEIERLQGRAPTEAWQRFIDRYRGFVTMVLRRLIWTPERSATASEEFWGYLFQSGALARLQRPMRFRAFLVGTLRNYAYDWTRRNPPLQQEGQHDHRADPSTLLPEDEEVALWGRQILHLAMQRLERDQPRWAWVLRSFYGLPLTVGSEPGSLRHATQLAAELQCSTNALHQLLFRARQRLRSCVVEEVRQTVSSQRDLDSELEVLLAALGGAAPGLVAAAPAPGRKSS
ncbi:MAG TPA: sigma-70 family RNA polymerase sigma factor [Planctomycetota bacterium]